MRLKRCALAACLLVLLPAPARAQPNPKPIRVRSASLRQDGQQLVWSIRTDDQFSPNELARDHRSLCIQIERASSDTAVGELCVRAPGGRRRPQLDYRHITRDGAGPPTLVSATVSRRDDEQLTARFLPAAVRIGYRPIRWQVVSTANASACATGPSPGLVCTARFPSFPALASLHTPRLVGCRPSGAPFVTGVRTAHRVVALTFDDGPWTETARFLDVLEREHVPATFFQIGRQISTYGQRVERRMLADGDMIGDHTWDHANVTGGGQFAASEISRTAAAIRDATGGFTPCLFRAPDGAVSSRLISEARAIGFTTIQWDVDPRDWARPGADAIYANVASNTRPGAIVIQHDGGGDRSETLAALPREIQTLKQRGYRFVTVTELLGQQLIYR